MLYIDLDSPFSDAYKSLKERVEGLCRVTLTYAFRFTGVTVS
jgi:hypothetical protein